MRLLVAGFDPGIRVAGVGLAVFDSDRKRWVPIFIPDFPYYNSRGWKKPHWLALSVSFRRDVFWKALDQFVSRLFGLTKPDFVLLGVERQGVLRSYARVLYGVEDYIGELFHAYFGPDRVMVYREPISAVQRNAKVVRRLIYQALRGRANDIRLKLEEADVSDRIMEHGVDAAAVGYSVYEEALNNADPDNMLAIIEGIVENSP